MAKNREDISNVNGRYNVKIKLEINFCVHLLFLKISKKA